MPGRRRGVGWSQWDRSFWIILFICIICLVFGNVIIHYGMTPEIKKPTLQFYKISTSIFEILKIDWISLSIPLQNQFSAKHHVLVGPSLPQFPPLFTSIPFPVGLLFGSNNTTALPRSRCGVSAQEPVLVVSIIQAAMSGPVSSSGHIYPGPSVELGVLWLHGYYAWLSSFPGLCEQLRSLRICFILESNNVDWYKHLWSICLLTGSGAAEMTKTQSFPLRNLQWSWGKLTTKEITTRPLVSIVIYQVIQIKL